MADRILVTGANGFVGSALCRRLLDAGFLVRGAVRTGTDRLRDRGIELARLHDESRDEDIAQAMQGVQALVHLAARVHVMQDTASDPLREFRRVNVAWTERLADAAARGGIRRFLYLSSIKVNGERTVTPFTEHDVPRPQDAYGQSKWEAEQSLAQIAAGTGMESVVIRAPLVYGPSVGGNFLQLLKIVHNRIPLPLASVQNLRSVVYRGNLIDAMVKCLQDKRAAGKTFLVSDGRDLSTPELIRRLAVAMGTAAQLFPFPVAALGWLGRCLGRQGLVDRLVGSLQVDSSLIQRELDWHPPFTVEMGLAETAAWYRTALP